MKNNIVLVEDNLDFAEIVAHYIEDSTDFSVVHFRNPKEALKFIKADNKGVAGVITDLIMREMDGIDFVSELRNTENGRYLSLFFLSGTDPAVFADLLRPYNICGFLEKPVDFKQLSAMIDKYFFNRSYRIAG